MILTISMRNSKLYEESDGAIGYKCRLEKLTGKSVLTMHYADVSPGKVESLRPCAIVITGSPDPWPTVPVADLYGLNDLLHQTRIPVLGICQGNQLIGHCFNHDLRRLRNLPDEPMRKCRPGEPDTGALRGHPGYYYEDAFVEIEVVRNDPVFAGLKQRVRVRANHRCEIKKMPAGFIHLARSANCKLEMIRHGTRLLYGMQFHAERWEEPYMAGRIIMANFFRLAGVKSVERRA